MSCSKCIISLWVFKPDNLFLMFFYPWFRVSISFKWTLGDKATPRRAPRVHLHAPHVFNSPWAPPVYNRLLRCRDGGHSTPTRRSAQFNRAERPGKYEPFLKAHWSKDYATDWKGARNTQRRIALVYWNMHGASRRRRYVKRPFRMSDPSLAWMNQI